MSCRGRRSGGKNCWKKAEQTSLFYPHPDGPKPSVRLKAFTRGQQDVEYLTLLCDVYNSPRYAVADWLNKMIDLKGRVYRSFQGDAGTVKFDKIDTTILWEIRHRVGEMLSSKAPGYKRSLVDWETPAWDVKQLPDIGYARVSPEVQRFKPDCDTFGPQ